MTYQNNLQSTRFTLLVRWVIVLALWVLLISMATGQFGISNYLELRRNREELSDLTMQLSIRNQMLEDSIWRLKTSRDAQLRYLKEGFGLVEQGEFVYHFGQIPTRLIRAKKKQELSSACKKSKLKPCS